jgi:RHS repeat-associated protein
MSGISSKAAGTLQNKDKTFQGQRFDDELGLNWIQFKWRNHDVQIGRFIEIDPLANDYVYNSTYAFSENKVTNDVELEGLESVSTNLLWPIFSWFLPSPEPKKKVETSPASNQSSYFNMNSFHAANSILFDAATLYVMPGEKASTEELEVTGSNGIKGAAWEQKVISNLAKEGNTSISEQVSMKAKNGVTVKLDGVSKSAAGKTVLTEAKSSATAPPTTNQKVAFPSIAEHGAVVVGKGKPGFPGGTVIPPTQVDIIRPKIFINTIERVVPPVVLPPKKQD